MSHFEAIGIPLSLLYLLQFFRSGKRGLSFGKTAEAEHGQVQLRDARLFRTQSISFFPLSVLFPYRRFAGGMADMVSTGTSRNSCCRCRCTP